MKKEGEEEKGAIMMMYMNINEVAFFFKIKIEIIIVNYPGFAQQTENY